MNTTIYILILNLTIISLIIFIQWYKQYFERIIEDLEYDLTIVRRNYQSINSRSTNYLNENPLLNKR